MRIPIRPEALRARWRGVAVLGTAALLAVGVCAAPAGALPGAQRSAGAWQQARSTPPLRDNGRLVGAACTGGGRFCIAVGNAIGASGARVAYAVSRGPAGGWLPMPALPRPPAAFSTDLVRASCATSRACLAVGSFQVGPGTTHGTRALAYFWNGSRWRRTPLPGAGPHTRMTLTAVSCAPGGACAAVGSTAGGHRAVAYRWQGRRWSATRPVDGGRGTTLSSVACPGLSLCFAVGSTRSGQRHPAGLTERWDGRRWTVVRAASGAALDRRWQLTGVSCADESHCTALGATITKRKGYEYSFPTRIVLASLVRGRWSIAVGVSPGKRGTFGGTGALSCRTAGDCAGIVYAGGPVVLRRHGGHTSLTRVRAGRFQAADVACGRGAERCLLVGSVVHGPTGIVRFPDPGGVVATPAVRGAQDAQVFGTACTGARTCFAVGQVGGFRHQRLLVLRSTGGAWAPSQVQAPPTRSEFQGLSAVSCGSASACLSVGSRLTNAGRGEHEHPLAEFWNGHVWKLAHPRTPSTAPGASLLAVSCPVAHWCMATGTSEARNPNKYGGPALTEVWNGSNWRVLRNPLDHGLLDSVSCTSRSSCVAVGPKIIERWDGTSWTVETPAKAPNRPGLRAVSCVSGGTCTVVGRTTPRTWLVETSTGANRPWTVAATGSGGPLDSVDCLTARRCAAVGTRPARYTVDGYTFHYARTFVLGGGAGSWHEHASPNPANGDDELYSVSCRRGGRCVGVGTSTWQLAVPLVVHGRI